MVSTKTTILMADSAKQMIRPYLPGLSLNHSLVPHSVHKTPIVSENRLSNIIPNGTAF